MNRWLREALTARPHPPKLQATREDLSGRLLALLFVAVLATLLLQTLGMEIFRTNARNPS